MDNQKSQKQRKHERVPCNYNVTINDSIVCMAFDISEGGMFLLTDYFCEPGKVIKISLFCLNKKIDIHSEVRYCHKGIGIGIMFTDVDDTLKETIKELVNYFKELTPYSL
jgi:hypothetical protein